MTELAPRAQSAQDVPLRYVIFHLPGPAWLAGVSPFAQPGLAAHLQHLGAAYAAGKIELAGPFPMDGAGGMVVTTTSCTEQEARSLAEQDPAVKSGLIRADVRTWMTTLVRSPEPPPTSPGA